MVVHRSYSDGDADLVPSAKFSDPMTINMKLVHFSFSMAIFSHYFYSTKTQVIGIRFELKVNEKVTKTKHSQTPKNGVNIYFTIKPIASLHFSCLWSSGQKILH